MLKKKIIDGDDVENASFSDLLKINLDKGGTQLRLWRNMSKIYHVGIDIGSTTIKVIILNSNKN